MLDIYPARELPIPGVTSEIILKEVKLADKNIYSKEDVISELKKRDLDVVVTFGAGDIDRLVPIIRDELRKQHQAASKEEKEEHLETIAE